MACLSEETIEALVTGFLDEEARRDAAAHLRQCAVCRELVRQTQIVYQALDAVFPQESREGCPSGEELGRYEDGELGPEERKRVDQHLKICVRCAADLYELRKQGQALAETEYSWTDRQPLAAAFTAIPIVYAAAAAIPSIATWARRSVRRACKFPEPVKLACLVPRTQQARRLAAATGRRFRRQVLDAGESPFRVEMVEFGDEVRLALLVKEEAPDYANCLVRLTLAEADDVRLTRVIAVTQGKGSCILHPEEVASCAPKRQSLAAVVEVLDAERMLREAAEADLLEALKTLLRHTDSSVRRSAVELLAESRNPKVADAVAALREDPDQAVRKAVAQALSRLRKKPE